MPINLMYLNESIASDGDNNTPKVGMRVSSIQFANTEFLKNIEKNPEETDER